MAMICAIAAVAVTPLVLSPRIEDVFFLPWRMAAMAFIGVAAMAASVDWLRRKATPAVAAAELPWIAFALWALASALWSVNRIDCLRRGAELAFTVAALWLGVAVAREQRRVWTACFAAIAVTSLYGLAQVIGLDFMPWSATFGGRAFGTLANPDYYAGHLMLVIPVAAARLIGRGHSPTLLAAFGLFVAGFLFSQVRGAWLAGGATTLAAAWYGRHLVASAEPRKRLIRGALAVGVIALAMFGASPQMRDRAASIFRMGGYDGAGRRYLWRVAANIWRERMLFGFGTGSYRYQFPRFQHIGEQMGDPQFRSYNYSEHAHNELLQFGAELGGVGVALFIWGLVAWGLQWRRDYLKCASEGRTDEAWTQLGLGTGIVGCLAYSWVNFPFQVVPTALLWWLMLGMSLELGRESGRMQLPRAVVLAGVLLIPVAFAGALFTGSDMVGSGYLRELHGMTITGNYPGAAAAGARAERLLGHDFRVFRWMSRLGIVTGSPDLVETGVRRRLVLHPNMLEPLSDRVELARKLKNSAEAERLARELVAQAPNYAIGWAIMGEICFERREFARAVEAFTKAVYLQEDNAAWHHNLASALGSMKRYREAMKADEEAIRRDPRFVDAYIGIALSARAIGDRRKALEIIARAREIAPEDGRLYTLQRQVEK